MKDNTKKTKRRSTLALLKAQLEAVRKPPLPRLRWRQEQWGTVVSPIWYADGLYPFNITINRISKGDYSYSCGRGEFSGSASTLAQAKRMALIKLVHRLSELQQIALGGTPLKRHRSG
jgi:hypothetical protein